MENKWLVIGCAVLFAMTTGCFENASLDGSYRYQGVVLPELTSEVALQTGTIDFDGWFDYEVSLDSGTKAELGKYWLRRGILNLFIPSKASEQKVAMATTGGALLIMQSAFNVVGDFEGLTFAVKTDAAALAAAQVSGQYHGLSFTYDEEDKNINLWHENYFLDGTGYCYSLREDRSARDVGTYTVNGSGKVSIDAEIIDDTTHVIEGQFDPVHKVMILSDTTTRDGDGVGIHFMVKDELTDIRALRWKRYNIVKMTMDPTDGSFKSVAGELLFTPSWVFLRDGSGKVYKGRYMMASEDYTPNWIALDFPGKDHDVVAGFGSHDAEVLVFFNRLPGYLLTEGQMIWAFKASTD